MAADVPGEQGGQRGQGAHGEPRRTLPLSPLRAVVGFGLVSLFADMVYEGARSLYGPVLLSLGASAALVGLVAGAGEAMALVLRLIAGPVADRRGSHWSFTIAGYATTAVCVPLLAVAPALGGLGLAFATAMILLERTGKAVRSPSKSALLAVAARRVGRGSGFGIHKALDQVGAFAGPLLVAGVAAASGGALWPALGWLAIPGAIAMAILLALRARLPDPRADDAPGPANAFGPGPPPAQRVPAGPWWRDMVGAGLPREFFWYAVAAALTTGGLAGFALIAVHLTRDLGVPAAAVPLWYAAAMLVEAVAALGTGRAYDRVGARVLLAVPVLVAAVPIAAFAPTVGAAAAGVGLWGAVSGIQDSTVKALVADLVPTQRLASAYGVFAAIQGALAIVGGLVVGLLLDRSVPALSAVVAVAQLAALILLVRALRLASRGR